jgi:hypothetical protein
LAVHALLSSQLPAEQQLPVEAVPPQQTSEPTMVPSALFCVVQTQFEHLPGLQVPPEGHSPSPQQLPLARHVPEQQMPAPVLQEFPHRV